MRGPSEDDSVCPPHLQSFRGLDLSRYERRDEGIEKHNIKAANRDLSCIRLESQNKRKSHPIEPICTSVLYRYVPNPDARSR